jgi:hypothetical protein
MARIYSMMLLFVVAFGSLPATAAPRTQPTVTSQIAQPGAINADFMGMAIRDPWYDFATNPTFPGQPNQAFQDTMGANLERIGVRWVRMDFHIEVPLANVNVDQTEVISAEIAKNDYFINTVAPQHNFKVLALLSFDLLQGTDAHILNTAPFTETSKFGGGVNRYTHAWLTRALMIADRYREKIAAYEVLNEENRLPQYVPNGPAGDAIQPAITARLLTKFYRLCKNIDPINENHGCSAATRIILGGIHPRGTLDGKGTNLTDAGYLSAVYAISDPNSPFMSFKTAHPSLNYPVDGIGYHPYPQEIRLSPNDALVNKGLSRMRTVLNTIDPNQQFWITEVGYNTGFDPDGPKNPIPAQTDAGQVAFMRDVYTSLAQRQLGNGQPEIANVFWFKYEDFPPATGANAQRWGVVHIPFTEGDPRCPAQSCYEVNGTPSLYRGSFLAYRELAGLPLNRAFMPLARR